MGMTSFTRKNVKILDAAVLKRLKKEFAVQCFSNNKRFMKMLDDAWVSNTIEGE